MTAAVRAIAGYVEGRRKTTRKASFISVDSFYRRRSSRAGWWVFLYLFSSGKRETRFPAPLRSPEMLLGDLCRGQERFWNTGLSWTRFDRSPAIEKFRSTLYAFTCFCLGAKRFVMEMTMGKRNLTYLWLGKISRKKIIGERGYFICLKNCGERKFLFVYS